MDLNRERAMHWARNRNVTVILLGVWLVVSFGVLFFAEDLQVKFFGWPFSFWFASQGALIVYCVIIWLYARYMNRLDREFRRRERE